MVAFAAALGIGLLGFPSPVAAWDTNSFSSTSEKTLHSLQNKARASAGKRSLKWDSALARIARKRSKDMIVRGYFSHNIPPDGHLVFREMKAAGYCFKTAGENIGWNNYPDSVATAAIFDSFMSSSGHRSNILSSKWDVVGIGAYKGPTGKKMWTVLFADKCGSVSTSSSKPKSKSPTKAPAKPKPKPKPAPPPVAAAPTPPPREPSDPESDESMALLTAKPPPEPDPTWPPGTLRVHEPDDGPGIIEQVVGAVFEAVEGSAP
jgi:hypothetical protein